MCTQSGECVHTTMGEVVYRYHQSNDINDLAFDWLMIMYQLCYHND